VFHLDESNSSQTERIVLGLVNLAEKKKSLVNNIFKLTVNYFAATEAPIEHKAERLFRLLENRQSIIDEVNQIDDKISGHHERLQLLGISENRLGKYPSWRNFVMLNEDTRDLLLEVQKSGVALNNDLMELNETLSTGLKEVQLNKQRLKSYTAPSNQLSGAFVDKKK